MKNNIDINKIPSTYGVYIWKNNDEILYIGKAKNLKNRIKQYLQGSTNSYKTPILMERANDIEIIICSNEKEALILEQELIKKNKPYFNILLLDDKKYPYIVIELKSNKLEIKTKFFYKQKNNTYYFGPLPPNYGYKTIKNFLIRECLYENGLPIVNNNSTFWKEKFEYAKKILSSSNSFIIKKLKKQMEIASENEQYELALEFRDIINHLSNKNENQSITFNNNYDFDVIGFKEEENFLFISVNNYKNGSFFMKEEFILEINIDVHETTVSFFNNYYSTRNIPDKIYSNYNIDNEETIVDKQIIVPKKGTLLQAVENALKNIEIGKEQKILQYKNKLSANLKIKKFFTTIIKKQINDFIMIDNSNENNTDIVSAIIYYKNFVPYYSNYRKYKIEKNINRKSDVEYMRQSISKYFKNKEEKPDLIIVDGGKQQLNEVKKTLKELKIDLPIIGLVKNQNHETDYLIDQKGKKWLLNDRQIYIFLAKIQTEVDSIAKNYHSTKKIHSSLEGVLSTISGIGYKKEQELLNHFKTYTNIYNATEEELSSVVSKSLAKKIKQKLQK